MAQYQSEYPKESPTDEYGNPIQHGVTGATTGHGIHDTTPVTGTGCGTHGVAGEHRENKGVVDQMKEKLPGGRKDDPYSTTAGEHRENKGVVDQMKEKLPGGQLPGGRKDDPYSTTAGEHRENKDTTAPGYGVAGEHRENKGGMVDKIKENLPCGPKDHTTTTGAPPYSAATGEHPEKKGMMDKIKEKLPGGHSTTR